MPVPQESPQRRTHATPQALDASCGRVLAEVGHELRSPLTAIIGEADVTLRDPAASAAVLRRTLEAVLAHATYLGRRLDDLQALSGSPDGALDIARDTVDLNIIVAEAMWRTRSLAGLHDVEVRFDPIDEPVVVRGDPDRLRQALMILLDHAIKVSECGKIVDIAFTRREASVDLAVTDRGRGSDAEALQRVFERDDQAETGRRMGGMGLGLSIARQIIEAHGGTIVADRNEAGDVSIKLTLDRIDPR